MGNHDALLSGRVDPIHSNRGHLDFCFYGKDDFEQQGGTRRGTKDFQPDSGIAGGGLPSYGCVETSQRNAEQSSCKGAGRKASSSTQTEGGVFPISIAPSTRSELFQIAPTGEQAV